MPVFTNVARRRSRGLARGQGAGTAGGWKDCGMGLWCRRPTLESWESVRWTKAALWLRDPSHTVRGRLYLTEFRLLFEPTRFHSKGWHWYALPHQISSVGVEGSNFLPRPGGLPLRLRIDLTDGRAEFLVVNHLEQVVEVIGPALASSST